MGKLPKARPLEKEALEKDELWVWNGNPKRAVEVQLQDLSRKWQDERGDFTLK